MTNLSPLKPKTGHTLREISDWVHRCNPAKDKWKERVDHHDAVAIACAALHDLGYQPSTPISLTKRLPGPEHCDSKGRCWVGYVAFVDETDYGEVSYNASWELCKATPDDEVWLPHDYLPTPSEPAMMEYLKNPHD